MNRPFTIAAKRACHACAMMQPLQILIGAIGAIERIKSGSLGRDDDPAQRCMPEIAWILVALAADVEEWYSERCRVVAWAEDQGLKARTRTRDRLDVRHAFRCLDLRLNGDTARQ